IIKLPKLGQVKFAKSRELNGRILNAIIRKNPSGKFFVSILCEEEIPDLPETGLEVGLGITDFAILSNGQKIDNNRFTSKME
ncbi:IS200/IS605 family element RNA-guided endonuclease TnpB, partial [Enterococcus avium]|nr:transposase [Enterococcus avium]